MERLLVDAEKLSGQKYDIGNFADVIAGINVVQTELGITGTTAKEASTTIEGSFKAMSSAWSNMLRGLSDENANFDGMINNLVTTASTFGKNILPRIKIALEGIGKLVDEFVKYLPTIIMEILPSIIDSGAQIIGSLALSLLNAMPQLLQMGIEMISTLAMGLIQNLPYMIQMGTDIIQQLITTITENIPYLLQLGIDILQSCITGIVDSLPSLIPVAIDAVLTLVNSLLDNIDMIIDAGIKLLIGLADGLINALPMVIEKVPIIIGKLLNAVASNIPKLIEAGFNLVVQLGSGLIKAIPQLLMAIPQLMGSVLSAFGTYYSELFDVGKNIVVGIWEGISGAAGWLWGKVKGFAKGIIRAFTDNDALDINSPSKTMKDKVGIFIPQGIVEGIEEGSDDINAAVQRSIDTDVRVSGNAIGQSNNGLMSEMIGYLKIIADKNPNIDIDGRSLKRALAPFQEEDIIYNSRGAELAY